MNNQNIVFTSKRPHRAVMHSGAPFIGRRARISATLSTAELRRIVIQQLG